MYAHYNLFNQFPITGCLVYVYIYKQHPPTHKCYKQYFSMYSSLTISLKKVTSIYPLTPLRFKSLWPHLAAPEARSGISLADSMYQVIRHLQWKDGRTELGGAGLINYLNIII